MSFPQEQCDGSHFVAGYNPKFVAAVHAKRRDEKRQANAAEARRKRKEEERLRKEVQERLKRAQRIQRELDELSARTIATLEAVKQGAVSPKQIVAESAILHGVSVAQILGKSRASEIVLARRYAIARIYVERPDLSLTQVGREVNVDHTSALHAVKVAGVWRNPGRPGQ